MASNSLNSRAILFGALVLLCCSLRAQEIRCNYRSGSISHISTEYEPLRLGADSAWVRLEKAGFQEGCIYLLYINLEQAAPVVAPKGVKMALNLNKGGIIRTEQIGEDSPTKPKLENGLYCNRLKYALDPRDMEKILGGVRSVDIVTGWNPDDYLQATFKDNEFSALLGRHFAAIEAGEGGTIALSAELAAYSDNLESILATTKPIVARGEKRIYNVILSYLYYKNSNTDDIDLAFQIGTEDSYRIPLDAEVVFFLGDGLRDLLDPPLGVRLAHPRKKTVPARARRHLRAHLREAHKRVLAEREHAQLVVDAPARLLREIAPPGVCADLLQVTSPPAR